ncbi:LytR C-terminal domain-containing protein [Pseudoglutamicibacter cumminsii]|uniref:LytR/CpsA/Psr regulator C-terminal domain-containing protein n=1 Tax=Pseudoglutamicibacter cumminsii TaxID=156979 RepID=A0ABX5L587_9MICC|nr:LytR C-terminal domain-containing protein [Pseudoglutamicibacter cumminsii]PWI27459.1 hypothetical protein CAY35_07515 [Pseudoglutamicibacter cumminsii]
MSSKDVGSKPAAESAAKPAVTSDTDAPESSAEGRPVASEPLPSLISDEDRVIARRSRAWVVAGLVAIGVAGTALGFTWWQRGTWTPDFRAPNPAVVCPVWPLTPAEPADVSLNVFNASPREGIAAEVADTLRERGFDVRTVRNATLDTKTAESVALIYAGPDDTAAALAVQNQIPGSEVVLQPDRTNGILDVALGIKYGGVASLESIPKGSGTLKCTNPWFER